MSAARQAQGSSKLFADETTAPVLDPGRGRTKTGQLWAYARDDRPGRAGPPGVAYVYAPDRKAERPIAHLDGFTGTLQVDGYAGYRVLAESGHVQLAFCWGQCAGDSTRSPRAVMRRSPARRSNASPGSMPSRAISVAACAEERRNARLRRSRPIIDELEPWLRAKKIIEPGEF